MIHDRVENLARYGAGDWWDSLCRVVCGLSDAEPEGERILGDGLLLRVLRYETKPPERCRFEGHRNHIDIQFTLAGAEAIDVAGQSLEHHPHDEVLSQIYSQAAKASYLSLN